MLVFFILALMAVPAAQGEGVLTATLTFETEGLDLDAGTVTLANNPRAADGTDIRIAYNAQRSLHAVVVLDATEGVELAFVAGVAFDGVTAESAVDLTFSPEPVDAPFSSADTVVVRTTAGAMFKLGNASESGTGVTFNYVAL